MKRNIWLLLSTILFVGSLWFFFYKVDYVERLSHINGVVNVEKFYEYEGHRFAMLNLENGGHLKIRNFDDRVFSNTDFISLQQIGDQTINCSRLGVKSIVSGAFNIIEYAKVEAQLNLKNISDIVEHYDEVKSLLNVRLPVHQQNAIEVSFTKNRSSETDKYTIRCFLKKG